LSTPALSTLASSCYVVHSRDVHPCFFVPTCPLPRFQPLLYCPCHVVHSRDFSRLIKMQDRKMRDRQMWGWKMRDGKCRIRDTCNFLLMHQVIKLSSRKTVNKYLHLSVSVPVSVSVSVSVLAAK